MFWLLWLPISILCLGIIIVVCRAIAKKGTDVLGGIGISVVIAFIVFFIGGYTSDVVARRTPAQSIYVDLAKPIYLVPAPDQEGVYLYADEDIDKVPQYIYYFISSQPIYPEYPQAETIGMSEARIVYDSPEKPFFAYVRFTCKASYFWLLSCKNSSPYTVEFHLPPNSIIPLPK